jgi:hypothetical protein
VLGHRGPCHRQVAGELAHGARAVREPLEDRPPCRVTEEADPVLFVSFHLP